MEMKEQLHSVATLFLVKGWIGPVREEKWLSSLQPSCYNGRALWLPRITELC